MNGASERRKAVDLGCERDRVGEWALGRWRLEEVLGSGGMSTVYGGVHRTNGKRVAVKILHAHLSRLPSAVSRFLAEARVANRVDHPGAVSVIDDGAMGDGAICLVMEKLSGGSLDQWIDERGPLALPEAMLVLDRLLDILDAAHRSGVIHRDVKPDNVFVTVHGAVKLVDFGIARSTEVSSNTQTGAIMGTPAYMPPEQAEGRWEEVDPRADVFAAGAVAIALLSGELPRVCETPNLTLLAAMSIPLESVMRRGLVVPPLVGAVIDKAIAWRREDRFPTAAAMAQALRTAWVMSFGSHLDGHDRHLATIGRALASPRRESGVAPALSSGCTATLPARPSATFALRLEREPQSPEPHRAAPPLQHLSPSPRAPRSSLALAQRASRRPLLLGALVFVIVLAMTSGIAFARLVVPSRGPASTAEPGAPHPSPLSKAPKRR